MHPSKLSLRSSEERRLQAHLVRNPWRTPLIDLNDKEGAFYYVEIDIIKEASVDYGQDFCDWLDRNYEPLDFLVRLAQEHGVVAMDGTGFDSPRWTLRLSLANLDSEAYAKIGISMDQLLKEYEKEYLDQK